VVPLLKPHSLQKTTLGCGGRSRAVEGCPVRSSVVSMLSPGMWQVDARICRCGAYVKEVVLLNRWRAARAPSSRSP
jgi:hypothetical protein